MPMVQPTLESDLKKLKQEFVHRYHEGSCVLYIALTNESGEEHAATEEDKRAWSPLWNQQSNLINSFVGSDPYLSHLKDRMFFVCNGNHRLFSWMRHIRRLYSNEIDWHYLVNTIVLDTNGKSTIVLSVMHDINT